MRHRRKYVRAAAGLVAVMLVGCTSTSARDGDGAGDGAASDAAGPSASPALQEQLCPSGGGEAARVATERLAEGRLRLPPHDLVEVGSPPRFDEPDPVDDANFRFQYHALRYLWPVIDVADTRDDDEAMDLGLDVARSWVDANPRDAPASEYAWNDHATAWRAMVLACLHLSADAPSWLADALTEHREALADEDFYVRTGNHALNQDIGLLAIGCVLGDEPTTDLVLDRLGRLVETSVDEQGVTNEQAVEYQDYNAQRFLEAAAVLEACDLPEPSWMARIEAMPEVLAHLSLPDGTYAQLGDTDRREVLDLDHAALRYLRTGGEEGAPPEAATQVFEGGFAVARTGWGLGDRALEDESMLTVRFGRQRRMHGHDDHGSLTLYSAGQRLLTDPGKVVYGDNERRDFALSREAHNVVTWGCEGRIETYALLEHRSDGPWERFELQMPGCEDVTWERTVAFDRERGAVVVEDRLPAGAIDEAVQRWQLEFDADVTELPGGGVHVTWPSGASLRIDQVLATSAPDVVSGQDDPLRGWLSPRYGSLEPAPNVAFTAAVAGDDIRYVTVLRPDVGPDAAAPTWEDAARRVLTYGAGDELRRVELGTGPGGQAAG